MARGLKEGKKTRTFYRRYDDKETVDASKLAYQVEMTVDTEIPLTETATKDGNAVSPGVPTVTLSSTALATKGDGGVELWEQLREWAVVGDKVEIFAVDEDTADEDGNYWTRYFKGYFSNVSEPYGEGNVEVSYDFTAEGLDISGTDLLSPEQIATLKDAESERNTIQATGAPVGE